MKILAGELAAILASRGAQRPRFGTLVRFLLVLTLMVATYAVIFKALMAREGQDQTWVTAFYWVLTVMSTLGFGDITFHTDAGRLFSILVLMSGMLFLLVLLPFIFIEFFYQPWMAAQTAARAPRKLKKGTRGHVIVTHLDAVAAAFIHRLESYHREYVLLESDLDEALRLRDHGYRVVVGEVDDPETYRSLCASEAELIVATGSDAQNTLIASTVREVSETVPIIATADDAASIDLLSLAECQEVLHLPSQMASALARRVIGGDNRTHIIGSFERLRIAEANTHGTELVGRAIRNSEVRERAGARIVGVWEHGAFEPAAAEMKLGEESVLLLAGTDEQLAAYDDEFANSAVPEGMVLILGGGRVGRLTARALQQRGLDYRVVEQNPERPGRDERWVVGNAAELSVLKEAGIDEASTIIITTHDDDTNVYLTVYCRKLRPQSKILCRATNQRNVSSLVRAGADFVLSYSSMGAILLFNSLHIGDVMIVAEGLNLFRVDLPPTLNGKRLAESGIREKTGASVVAVEYGIENWTINPPPDSPLTPGSRLILIGAEEAEQRFLDSYGQRG